MVRKSAEKKLETAEKPGDGSGLGKMGRKILFELDTDSSQTLGEIGKKIRKSPQYVEYWINKLSSEGYVKDFVTVIDYKKLGYSYYTIYISFKMMDPIKEQKFIDYLAADKSITILYSCYGEWDVVAGMLAKDPVEIYEKISNVKRKFGEAIGDLIVETHVGSKFFGRRHLSDDDILSSSAPISGERADIVDFDDKDIKLLSALKDNARASTIRLAEISGLTPDMVRYRLKRLRSEKVILRSSILPDYTKINWKFFRLLLKLKGISAEKEKELFSFFESKQNVIRFTREFGSYDVSVDVEVYGETKLSELIRELKSKFYGVIAEYDSIQIARTEKSYYFLSV